jgi:RNA polymerase sigma-70 factor (ECF subfamily)
MNTLTDKIAIIGLQKHSEKALRYLMDKYTPYVATVVSNIIRQSMSEQDIEETIADVFITLWNNAENIQADSVKSYLGVTARNKAINKLRELHITIDIEDNDIPDNNFLRHIEQNELSDIIEEALNELTPIDREIFIRYYWYFQKTNEIASALNLTVTSVTSKLSRGRKKLKTILTERGFYYED